MSAIVAVGSMAFDSIETPFGKVGKILGGSVNHFSLAACYFAPVQCISVVGEDFPAEHLELLKRKQIDIQGIRRAQGKTFHWSGRYEYDLNTAHTLSTCLNVFEKFDPEVPAAYRNSEFVFLGNTAPALQNKVLSQIPKPKLVAIDTMNFWIESQKAALIEVIGKCDVLIINEAEIRQLTKQHNIVQAGKTVQSWGPGIIVVKRGEYGAVLFNKEDIFGVPGLPLAEVKDPTGAGDSFAGGFMGYLASHARFPASDTLLRKAIVYGSVMASFTVQEFGSQKLLDLTEKDIADRYKKFVELTAFHEA